LLGRYIIDDRKLVSDAKLSITKLEEYGYVRQSLTDMRSPHVISVCFAYFHVHSMDVVKYIVPW
jgi:hypothetical protein